MANTKQARKRAKQSIKHRNHNMSLRSRMRTSLKKVIAAIQTGDKTKAGDAFKEVVPVLDKMASKGLIHKNNAARHKSRLNLRIKNMQA
ncbi:MAG: 30S ribosomal protein S20 [Legionellales bacterium]|nr:30S ribosomal protein S20 [Legionellales bacterium]